MHHAVYAAVCVDDVARRVARCTSPRSRDHVILWTRARVLAGGGRGCVGRYPTFSCLSSAVLAVCDEQRGHGVRHCGRPRPAGCIPRAHFPLFLVKCVRQGIPCAPYHRSSSGSVGSVPRPCHPRWRVDSDRSGPAQCWTHRACPGMDTPRTPCVGHVRRYDFALFDRDRR